MILTLTPDQLRQVAPLLNQGRNVVAELDLASLQGEQSKGHIFIRQIGPKTAEKIRRAMEDSDA